MDDRIIPGSQQVARALAGAPPPTSISQVDVIANLWDIFKSWRLLAPPNLHLSDCPTPGFPRVHSHVAPRDAMLLPPTPSSTLTPTPTKIPLPPPLPSSLRCILHLHPVPTARQETPCWLDFGDIPAQPIRVPCVSPPAKSCHPPAPLAFLPVCKPISHLLLHTFPCPSTACAFHP